MSRLSTRIPKNLIQSQPSHKRKRRANEKTLAVFRSICHRILNLSQRHSLKLKKTGKPPGPRTLTVVIGRTLHGKTQKLKIYSTFSSNMPWSSKQDAEASVESPRPQLCTWWWRMVPWRKSENKTKQSWKSYVSVIEEPKAGVSSSGETAVKPGETEGGCIVSDVTQTLKNNTDVWKDRKWGVSPTDQ